MIGETLCAVDNFSRVINDTDDDKDIYNGKSVKNVINFFLFSPTSSFFFIYRPLKKIYFQCRFFFFFDQNYHRSIDKTDN